MASETIKRVRLGEVASMFIDGDWIESKDQSSEGFRLVQTGNIGVGEYLNKSDRAKYVSVETFERLKCTEIFAGDVLVSRLPDPVGRACVLPDLGQRAITAVDCSIVRFDSAKCDANYFVHFTKSKEYERQLSKYLAGSTRIRISRKNLQTTEIPLPPLPAQRRIAAALDKISEMKRNAEARLQKLDLLVKARFNEMFGDGAYEEKELSAVTTFIDYRGKTPTKSESGVPLITAKNVRSFGFSIEPREYIPEEMYLGWMTRGFPAVGDVLFTTEAPLGNVCRIPNVYDKFAVGQRIVTMQPHRDILDATYLEFALRSGAFQRKVFEKSSGSTVTGIRSKLLEKLALPLPPLSLQRSFAAFVEKVEALKATAQASLERVDLLYRAKLQEYFG